MKIQLDELQSAILLVFTNEQSEEIFKNILKKIEEIKHKKRSMRSKKAWESCVKNGNASKRGRPRKADYFLIKTLRDSGLSVRQISNQTGFAKSSIQRSSQMRTPSKYKTRTHLASLEDKRIPICKSKIWDFPSSENYLEIDCVKCRNIINALYRDEFYKTKNQFVKQSE